MEVSRQTLDIEIYRGDDIYEEVIVVDDDEVAVDLTGCTFSAQVRRHEDTEDVLLPLEVVETTGGALSAGQLTVLSVQDTSDLDFGPDDEAVWDLQIITAEATPLVVTAFKGTVTYVKDVTRD